MITDVAIIGSGYTALSTAYHLNKLGPVKAVLINDGIDQSHEIRQSEHAVISTYFDQVTRIVNAFGREDAEKMISFSNEAYEYLKVFVNKKKLVSGLTPLKELVLVTWKRKSSMKSMRFFVLRIQNHKDCLERLRFLFHWRRKC